MSFDEQWARAQWAHWTGYSQESVGSAVLALAREAYERGRAEALASVRVPLSGGVMVNANMIVPSVDYAALFREYAGMAMQALVASPQANWTEALDDIAAQAVACARALVEAVRKEEANAG